MMKNTFVYYALQLMLGAVVMKCLLEAFHVIPSEPQPITLALFVFTCMVHNAFNRINLIKAPEPS